MAHPMVRRGNIGTLAALAVLAEIVVFALVADRIGFGSAVLLTVMASVLGMATLKRSGASALRSLRAAANEGMSRETALVDGLLGAIGAILLIIPGFLTDLVGLCLLAPSGRQWLLQRLGSTSSGHQHRRARANGTIDLGADDWTRIDTFRSP